MYLYDIFRHTESQKPIEPWLGSGDFNIIAVT